MLYSQEVHFFSSPINYSLNYSNLEQKTDMSFSTIRRLVLLTSFIVDENNNVIVFVVYSEINIRILRETILCHYFRQTMTSTDRKDFFNCSPRSYQRCNKRFVHTNRRNLTLKRTQTLWPVSE